MKAKPLLLAALIAAPLFVSQAAHAQSFDIRIGTPPPPPRVIAPPPPRPGFVWAPGYWAWNGRRHVWYDGHWERVRRGYHYVEPGWARDRDAYGFRRGHWEHD